MAKATIEHNPGCYVVQLSDGTKKCDISPMYRNLNEAKIFRKAFELGRANPGPLYNGFPVEFDHRRK